MYTSRGLLKTAVTLGASLTARSKVTAQRETTIPVLTNASVTNKNHLSGRTSWLDKALARHTNLLVPGKQTTVSV